MSLDEPDVTRGGSATSLVLTVMTNQPGPERERAMADLEPVIRRLARRVACAAGAGTRRARDFEDEAPAYLWEKLPRFDPGRARFETWCRMVLRNRLIDQARQGRRDPLAQAELLGTVVDARGCGTQGRLEAALDRVEPLGQGDLEQIGRWLTEDRILLLCLSGLWLRVPDPIWTRWIEECDLEPPFPPAEFAALDTLAERNAVLAPALGLGRNTLSQRWLRKQALLKTLAAVAELTDEP